MPTNTVVGSARAIFTISLVAAATEEVRVDWATKDGTALAGRDYETNSGTVAFAPGETVKTVEVFVHGRTVETEDRVFYVLLEPPVNAILADEIGACVIHVDTTGTVPVVSVIIPRGEKGLTGDSAYQVALNNGFVGTQPEWLASLRPSPEELAPLVAPLIDAGPMLVTAAGTEALTNKDRYSIAEFVGRIAFMRTTKKAFAPALTVGTNVVPMGAFVGDAVDPTHSTGFNIVALRAGALESLSWTYLPATAEIQIDGAVAGDTPIAVQQDVGSGDMSKVPVSYSGVTKQLRQWIASLNDNYADAAERSAVIEADVETLHQFDTALATNDGDAMGAKKIGYKKTTLYGRFKNTVHVSEFGIEGTPARADAPAINEGLKIATAVQQVAAVNEELLFDARNYLLDREITVGGNFRSFKLKGAGVGNANTWSTGGTTLITTWGFGAIRVNLDTYVNENFRIEGMTFASSDIDMTGYPAIHVVRGAENGRYVSGFTFKDVSVRGFGSGAVFQGMNIENAGNNYFGTVIMDNFHVINTGIGVVLNNASLNLLDMRSPLFHVCPYGGIRLFRDGLVGAGNGRGSSITAKIGGKPQMEQVGGLFRTQETRTFGGTGTAEILRSKIHIEGLRHEFCGSQVLPTVLGDPWCLGVDTDIIITGDVDYDLGYGEVAFPRVGAGNTISSATPIRAQMDGGRSLTTKTVNAPTIRRTIVNTAATVISVTTPNPTSHYALKSDLILHGGLLGVIESRHNGQASSIGTKRIASTDALPPPASSGVNVAFDGGASGTVINCTVTNNSGSTIDVELQVENICSLDILTPHEL